MYMKYLEHGGLWENQIKYQGNGLYSSSFFSENF